MSSMTLGVSPSDEASNRRMSIGANPATSRVARCQLTLQMMTQGHSVIKISIDVEGVCGNDCNVGNAKLALRNSRREACARFLRQDARQQISC